MMIGIVGKPNCGKSTFFKALTLAEVEIANYPFVTIKPNSGVGYIKIDCVDSFFKVQCNPREGYCINHKRFVPVQIIDVAGLVPGAYEGKGMGNQFLDDLRQADMLIHVIDLSGSTNEKGEPVNALSYDPAEDIKFLEFEMDMWYYGIMKKGWDKFARQIQQEHSEVHKAIGKQLSGLGVNDKMVESVMKNLGLESKEIIKFTDDDLKSVSTELRKITKPMIIACNKADVPGALDNLDRLKKQFPHHTLVPCSAECELALKESTKHGFIKYIPGESDFSIVDESKLSDKQKFGLNFIKENVLKKLSSTGVQNILNTSVLDILKYIAIYPGGMSKLADSKGNILPDCFLMPPGTTALDFAFRLHTDFGKNFIKAMDIKKRMPVGKDHKLQHCDVLEIMSN